VPTTPTEMYLPHLLSGDTDATQALFGGEADVDDPQSGRITKMTYFWAASRHMWLRDHKAELEPVAVTRAGDRCVVEVIMKLQVGGKPVALPVAVVGEEDGARLRRVRVYHTMWLLTGGHYLRGPVLPPDPELRAPDVVGAYQHALARGDVTGVLATLTDDAVVREPSGGEFTHTGRDAQRKLYESMLGKGGITLEHNTITDDGTTCVLEYTVKQWGDKVLTSQAGLAAYVRGKPAPEGFIVTARIYDDVERPG
jgi:hypothetical protein